MTRSGPGSSDGPTPAAQVRGWRTKPLDLVPEREQTSRLTLDFSGPLLPLPSGEIAVSTVAGPASGHDAWAVDHVRRSTPPPMQVTPGWLEHGFEQKRGSSTPPADAPSRAAAPGAQPSFVQAGTALDLVESARPTYSGVDLYGEMADRFALGDFSGALGVSELILGTRPGDPAASRYAEASREKLEQFYASRLGELSSRLRVAVRDSDVRWLGLDHRAGFLLSRIDGVSTIEEVIDTSGMPRLEALRTLSELLDQKAVERIVDAQRPRR